MTTSVSAKSDVKQSTGAVIQVDGLVKRYKDGTEALKNLVLEVQPGELFGLVGPDGAGKSTALKNSCRHYAEPTSGKALVLNSKPRDARRSIGYVAQGGALYPELSVDENLRYEAGMHGVGNREYAKLRETHLGNMGLLEFADRLAGQLSGGMKQKLALCCALVSKPKVIFLDEPTTGLDPISRRELWQALAVLGQEGVTAVVATPFLDEAERCNRIALMYDGSVHEMGKPSDLKNALGLSRLEIAVKNDAQTIRALSELNFEQSDNIVDICPFGDHIEVLCKDINRGREEVGIALAKANIEVSGIEESAPNLENVFVTKLKTLTKKEVRHIPFPHLKEKSNNNKQFEKFETLEGAEKLESAGKLKSDTASRVRSAKNNDANGVALKAEKLNMVFGKFKAVDNVDLELKCGEIFRIAWRQWCRQNNNHQNALPPIAKPTSGSVTILGDSSEDRSREIRKRIGYA